MQQHLEDNNEDGMIVFLDLEKAFNGASWDYILKKRSHDWGSDWTSKNG